MSSVVKLGDPEIAVHPVMITCCDLLWTPAVAAVDGQTDPRRGVVRCES